MASYIPAHEESWRSRGPQAEAGAGHSDGVKSPAEINETSASGGCAK